jgi:hypothetical protein
VDLDPAAPDGITLATVNGWLARHQGHPVEVERRRSEAKLYGEDPPPSAAAHHSVIITWLMCRQCNLGVTIRKDEPDTGDPIQLIRLCR